MLVKTSELQGATLDWAVAKCAGISDERIVLQSQVQLPGEKAVRQIARVFVRWLSKEHTSPQAWEFCGQRYEPSTDWAQGGPILERMFREGLEMRQGEPEAGNQRVWARLRDGGYYWHETSPLIAAMRCYVASKLGGEVEIPDGLM